MTTINRQTERIANWLSRTTFGSDLTALSDRALQDIGLSRRYVSVEGCKPFWMA